MTDVVAVRDLFEQTQRYQYIHGITVSQCLKVQSHSRPLRCKGV